MFNIRWVILFLIFQIVKPSQMSSEPKDIFYRSHNRILEIIDNVFISLNIDEKFKKSKNIAEYFSMHNFIQDAVEKNEQIYQNIRHTLKTNLSNKTSILKSQEVIDRTIRKEQSIIFKQLMKNNSKVRAIAHNDILKDFTELARDFHLKVNMSLANDIKSLASDFKNLYPTRRNMFQEAVSTIKKFPFMVSIHVRDYFTCAGSLLRDDLVISAASCLVQYISEDSDVTPLNVRVGSDYTNKNGDLIPIADLIFHSDFSPSNLNHNLVIIRLKKHIRLEKMALLKYDRIADDLPKYVEKAFYLGWGEKDINQHDDNHDKEEQKLSYARLNVYDFMDCLNHFSRVYISDQQFCAGIVNESDGVCKNDIGGPAIMGDTLVGVISFSSPHCGDPGAPTVFTKIGFYAKWITSVFETFPLHTQPEPETDPTYGHDSKEKSEDETIDMQKEEPKLRRRADPELNSTLKLTSSNDSLPFPLHTQPKPKRDPSTHEDDPQEKSEDETFVVQKEDPKFLRRVDRGLKQTNSTDYLPNDFKNKQTNGTDYLPNDVKNKQTNSTDSLPNDVKNKQTNSTDYLPNNVENDTLEQITKQAPLHTPEVTSLKTGLVPIQRMIIEKQANPTPSPVIQLSEPTFAADETTDKLDWIFVDNVFDNLLTVVKNPESLSLTTPMQMITPVFPRKRANITDEDGTHMTSSSLNIDRTTPFPPNVEDFNYFEEINKDHKQSKLIYENDIHINAKGDLSYENQEDSKVEVVIKEFGTTKLFVLDKKKANARESLAIIKEKLSKHRAIDWITMISTK